MSSYLPGLFASFALVVASLASFLIGAQASSAAAPASGHTTETEKVIGHQPTKTRATTVADRADAPQHRAAPWTPLAVVPTPPEVADRSVIVTTVITPSAPRLAYDAPAPHGRAPPR